jgi:DNA-binding MarR family transcriptional regulator
MKIRVGENKSSKVGPKARSKIAVHPYLLEQQVGFLLRQANQRHFAIFAEGICEQLTPTQFAAMAKLHQYGPLSQNRLGRLTAMDAATIKGVIDRLTQRKFTVVRADTKDGRLLIVDLSKKGREVVKLAIPLALRISAETLSPLKNGERAALLKLLRRLC